VNVLAIHLQRFRDRRGGLEAVLKQVKLDDRFLLAESKPDEAVLKESSVSI
jgi:hypothetical protein